jgi:hypothetical protein
MHVHPTHHGASGTPMQGLMCTGRPHTINRGPWVHLWGVPKSGRRGQSRRVPACFDVFGLSSTDATVQAGTRLHTPVGRPTTLSPPCLACHTVPHSCCWVLRSPRGPQHAVEVVRSHQNRRVPACHGRRVPACSGGFPPARRDFTFLTFFAP